MQEEDHETDVPIHRPGREYPPPSASRPSGTSTWTASSILPQVEASGHRAASGEDRKNDAPCEATASINAEVVGSALATQPVPKMGLGATPACSWQDSPASGPGSLKRRRDSSASPATAGSTKIIDGKSASLSSIDIFSPSSSHQSVAGTGASPSGAWYGQQAVGWQTLAELRQSLQADPKMQGGECKPVRVKGFVRSAVKFHKNPVSIDVEVPVVRLLVPLQCSHSLQQLKVNRDCLRTLHV